MKFRSLIYIGILLLLGCSSSSKFTAENRETNSSPVKSGAKDNDELILRETDEYSNMAALESEIGIASYYRDKFNGKKTANGEVFDQDKLTAAHLNYPFNTIVRVTNLSNNKSVVVRINDRLPDYNGRISDLSKKAAVVLNIIKKGICKVKLEVLKWGDK